MLIQSSAIWGFHFLLQLYCLLTLLVTLFVSSRFIVTDYVGVFSTFQFSFLMLYLVSGVYNVYSCLVSPVSHLFFCCPDTSDKHIKTSSVCEPTWTWCLIHMVSFCVRLARETLLFINVGGINSSDSQFRSIFQRQQQREGFCLYWWELNPKEIQHWGKKSF